MAVISDSNDETYYTVCEDLDQLAMEYFTLQEELLQKRFAMESVTKSAFFEMAQAKYLLGCTRMSMLQVDTSNMEAELKCNTEEQRSNNKKLHYSYKSFELIKTKDVKETSPSESDNNIGTRKRKHNLPNDAEDSSTKTEKPKNPLDWFGILVPKCLKDCQKYFQQATELSLDIAALQSKLKTVGDMYKQKRHLKQKSIKDH